MGATVKVSCPECGEDVSCSVARVQVFRSQDSSQMLVLFPCPSCRLPRIRSADIGYLERLLGVGVQILDPPDEMRDPRRVSNNRMTTDDLLDFVLALGSADDLIEEVLRVGDWRS